MVSSEFLKSVRIQLTESLCVSKSVVDIRLDTLTNQDGAGSKLHAPPLGLLEDVTALPLTDQCLWWSGLGAPCGWGVELGTWETFQGGPNWYIGPHNKKKKQWLKNQQSVLIGIWVLQREKSLMSRVVVIPKEGWARVWHWLFIYLLLKADRPHPRNYPHTPTDYRHTDKHLRLVMAPIALNFSFHDRWTDGRTDRQTDGRYQVHYLRTTRCFAVDKNVKATCPFHVSTSSCLMF